MKYNNISLPYPVLGINDDVYPLLEEDCIRMADPIKTPTEYRFIIDLTHRNEDIETLIEEGKAEYACEVTCSDTYLRHCYHSSDSHFEIVIPRRDVKGRVVFQCFVAAKQSIIGYKNRDFNEDYYGFSFDLEVGDMLVLFPSASYNTDVRYDKLFAAGSFMQIVEAADDKDRIYFNLNEDRILIEMPRDIFMQYKRVGNQFPEIIHSSIVHNALVYALANLSEFHEKGKLWADCIMIRMKEPALCNLDLSDMMQVYEAADILLQDPYKRLLDSLEKLNENLVNE